MSVNSFGNLTTVIPLLAFVIFLLLQALLPRRDLKISGHRRIANNVLLFFTNTLIMRFIVPFSLVLITQWSQLHSLGLINLTSIELNSAFTIIVCILLLDMAVYWQHVLTHKIPVLWRLHKVHHADHDMDATTAIRFHPIELLLSLVYKGIVIVIIGAPLAAVLIFELLLFVGPAFNHSNLRLPMSVDKILRWFIATPDMHRVHHSTLIKEQNTNYGFFLVWWDKLFQTYTDQPVAGHTAMKIGIDESDGKEERLEDMLLMPFR